MQVRELGLLVLCAAAFAIVATFAAQHLSALALGLLLMVLLSATGVVAFIRLRRRDQQMPGSLLTAQPRWHDQVPCYLTILDGDLRIIDHNEAFRRDFGDQLGEHCYLAFKNRQTPCPDCAAQLSLSDGSVHTGDEVVHSRDGREVDVFETAAPFVDSAGEVSAVTLVATDISESMSLRRQLDRSRRDYENLFASVPCFICVVGRDHHIVEANALYRQEFGSTDQDFCFEICKKRTSKCPDCIVDRTFADGSTHSEEETLVTRDGDRINVVVHTRPVFDDAGEITAVMEVFTDITQVKHLQRQLALMGRAVAGMAHRVKNILMGLEGGIFVVNTGIEGDDRQSMIEGWEMVQRNVRRVSRIVKDLLYCSKDRPPEFQPDVSPHEIVEEVRNLYASRVGDDSIDIKTDLSEQPWHRGEFDPEAIHSLLCNLVSNAIDACRFDPSEDKHRHTVTLRCARNTDGGTILQVEDDGAGIPEDLNNKVFQDFFSSKGTEGTGIGLLVVQKIAEEHGGKVTFSSIPGNGTTFTVTIPPR